MNMTPAEKIRVIAKRVGMSLGELAEATQQSQQNLSNKLARDNLSYSEIQAMAAAMGCEVSVNFKMPDGDEV